MKKKILHLITGLEVGGAETMLLRTLPLLQQDFENHVCCIRGHGSVAKLLQQQGIPVYFLDFTLRSFLLIPWRFFQVIRTIQPDLLVTYLIHADILGRISGRLFHIPKIICNRRGFYLNWLSLHFLDRLTSHLADAYIVQTKYAKSILVQQFRFDPEKVHVIPNSIDLSNYSINSNRKDLKKILGLPEKAFIISCTATLKPGKGLEELLDAFEQCFHFQPETFLVLIGDGPLRASLQKQILSYHSKNQVLFLGERHNVSQFLAASDIFVLPTHSEGMSNAILEAMASGLPIITTDIPVNQEIITDGISGTLIPIGSIERLKQAILDLITHPKSRITLGKNARLQAEVAFDIHRVLDKIKATYIALLYEK